VLQAARFHNATAAREWACNYYWGLNGYITRKSRVLEKLTVAQLVVKNPEICYSLWSVFLVRQIQFTPSYCFLTVCPIAVPP